jgi:hypothetical protein
MTSMARAKSAGATRSGRGALKCLLMASTAVASVEIAALPSCWALAVTDGGRERFPEGPSTSEPSALALRLPRLALVNAEGGLVEGIVEGIDDAVGGAMFAEISSVAIDSSRRWSSASGRALVEGVMEGGGMLAAELVRFSLRRTLSPLAFTLAVNKSKMSKCLNPLLLNCLACGLDLKKYLDPEH